jgi:hypothetical protein
MVALEGLMVIDARVPAVIVRVAVAVFPESLAVTVWLPAVAAVQVAPVQEPLGVMVNVVAPVTFPSELLLESNPVVVYVWLPPEVIVELVGLMVMWSSAPAFTVKEAVPALPASVPVTV